MSPPVDQRLKVLSDLNVQFCDTFVELALAAILDLTLEQTFAIAHRSISVLSSGTYGASGSNLTFESRRGFPIELAYASLAHAYRDFHDS
jgi:hypothetical protein